MSTRQHWYVRRQGEVKGPFLASHIRQDILLGRVREDDELSQDRQHWQAVTEHRSLYPEVMLEQPRDEEKIEAERMKLDERSRDRRAGKKNSKANERRQANDRRQVEPEEIVAFRETHHRVIESLNEHSALPPKRNLLLYLVGFIILLSVFSFQFQGGFQFTLDADCEAAAGPAINWRYCDKRNMDLTNRDLTKANLNSAQLNQSNLLAAKLISADISYANLSQANLTHANLQQAVMKGANLSYADLSYADLTGADLSFADLSSAIIGGVKLEQTRLDKAIWIDGTICSTGSIGLCRKP